VDACEAEIYGLCPSINAMRKIRDNSAGVMYLLGFSPPPDGPLKDKTPEELAKSFVTTDWVVGTTTIYPMLLRAKMDATIKIAAPTANNPGRLGFSASRRWSSRKLMRSRTSASPPLPSSTLSKSQ
jgi:hypothetical protein